MAALTSGRLLLLLGLTVRSIYLLRHYAQGCVAILRALAQENFGTGFFSGAAFELLALRCRVRI